MASRRVTASIGSVPVRITRRATVLGLPAAAAVGSSRVTGAQDAGTGETIGLASLHTNSFEFVAQINQQGFELGGRGYLTRLAALDHALMFTGSDPLARTEAEARLTTVLTSTGVSRSILNGVFLVNAEGTLDIHLNDEGGASFEDLDSFVVGDPICTLAVRIQSVITVFAPQMGLSDGYADAVIEATQPFELDGEPYVIGDEGQGYRLSFNGLGQLLDPEELISVIAIAGNAVTVP